MARNLQKLRSSGRNPIVKSGLGKTGRSSGSMKAVGGKAARSSGAMKAVGGKTGRTSGSMKAVRGSSTKITPIRKSSGQLNTHPASPEPESGLFRAMVPFHAEDEIQAVQTELANLRRLQEVIHFLGSAHDPHALKGEILDLGVSISGLSRGMLALPTSAEGKRRYKVKESRGYTEDDRPETKILRGILNRSLERRETLLDGSINHGGILEHADSSARRLQLGAVACLPLEARGELWGALILDDPERTDPFTAAEESLLRSFARHVGLAIARLHKASQIKRKLTLVTRKNERLEAERDHADRELAKVRRRSGRSSSQSARHDPKVEKAGRAYRRMLDLDYAAGKDAFTRAYLTDLLKRTEGNLSDAADESGLPVARLVGLLDKLGVKAPRRRLPRPSSRSPGVTSSTASHQD